MRYALIFKSRVAVLLIFWSAVKFYLKVLQLHAYADDINIVGRRLEVVCDVYLAQEAEAATVRLKIKKKIKHS
jgi:hypothetical protein